MTWALPPLQLRPDDSSPVNFCWCRSLYPARPSAWPSICSTWRDTRVFLLLFVAISTSSSLSSVLQPPDFHLFFLLPRPSAATGSDFTSVLIWAEMTQTCRWNVPGGALIQTSGTAGQSLWTLGLQHAVNWVHLCKCFHLTFSLHSIYEQLELLWGETACKIRRLTED